MPEMTAPALIRPLAGPAAGARVERLTEITPEEIERFLAAYRAAFTPLETLAPARQSLTDAEFREEMTDPRVLKFVGRDESGEAVALSFMALDLSIVPWVSVPYYAHRFPEHHARGAVYYVGALLVRPDRQGGPWVKFVVEDVLRYVAEHRGIVAFDCCGFNAEVVRLPDTIARAAHRVAYAETFELDAQRYYAYDLAGVR
jgi:hypothetical protein